MLYNRFTGILRIYYYHTNSAGTATTTFWRLAFDRPLSILNASGYFTHPMDWRPSAPEVYVSTINTVPAKSIYRGWNCFDVELCYDNQLAPAPTKMSIVAYSLSESNIDIRGGIKLSSEGSIVTKGNSNEWLGTANKVLNNASQGAGKVVMDTIQKKISNLEMLPKIGASAALAFASGGVSEAVGLGINLLAGSFFGKMGNPTTTMQDLRFKTNGTADFTGSMTTISGSEITPIGSMVVPGTPIISSDHFLPSFEEPLGVWNLQQQPVIKMGDMNQWMFARDLGGGVGEYDYLYRTIYLDNIQLIINPAVENDIQRYEIVEEYERAMSSLRPGDEPFSIVDDM